MSAFMRAIRCARLRDDATIRVVVAQTARATVVYARAICLALRCDMMRKTMPEAEVPRAHARYEARRDARYTRCAMRDNVVRAMMLCANDARAR